VKLSPPHASITYFLALISVWQPHLTLIRRFLYQTAVSIFYFIRVLCQSLAFKLRVGRPGGIVVWFPAVVEILLSFSTSRPAVCPTWPFLHGVPRASSYHPSAAEVKILWSYTTAYPLVTLARYLIKLCLGVRVGVCPHNSEIIPKIRYWTRSSDTWIRFLTSHSIS
jgi:hypothetical protein